MLNFANITDLIVQKGKIFIDYIMERSVREGRNSFELTLYAAQNKTYIPGVVINNSSTLHARTLGEVKNSELDVFDF